MVTISDVARRAGVAKQSVSNVLTGKAVRVHTRERVNAAIAELGYTPNLVARALARGKTFIIGLMIPTIANPFYAEFVEQVELIVQEQGYHLLLCTTNNELDRGKRHLQTLSTRSIDGLVLMEDRHTPELSQVVPFLLQGPLPVVICNREHRPIQDAYPEVAIDLHHAGLLAGRHLIELGHRDVGVIYEDPAHEYRLAGVQAAFGSHHWQIPASRIISTPDSTFEFGVEAGRTLLSQEHRPTAIVASNDLMALGILQAAMMAHIAVPDELSVIGIDNVAQGAYAWPPLTTIDLPKRELAAEATELLFRLITGQVSHRSTVSLIRPRLQRRRSTGPVPTS